MTAFPIILSSPSGGGKTSIARCLLQARRDVGYSVSCTTRPPREDEVEGESYYFLSTGEFLARQQRGEFAEAAEVHGNLYGTLRSEVARVLSRGQYVIMDIDVQGAAQFRVAFPQSVLIYVLPPSGEVLLERLRARNTESAASLKKRLVSALVELRAVPMYHYVVLNDDLERATTSVSGIIDAEGLRRERLKNVERDVRAIIERLERELDT
ncbi:MAG TPA: guanylate kinase [Gemmatimonadaceae bacterium]|nr:guanylate kinase [Gemmatimonadaceae bacterium]